MNAFAKYLFQALFSWIREAIRQLSDPQLIDSWLAKNWLSALIPLLLIGTVIDFIVWLIRWRPDLVWRSSLNRSASLMSEENRELRRFRKGFDKENAEIGAVAKPLMDPGDDYELTDPQPQADDAYYDWQFATPMKPETEQPPVRHRRSDRYRKPARSSRAAQRRTDLMEEDDAAIDGLPPRLSKEEAFRAPVYPRTEQDDRR